MEEFIQQITKQGGKLAMEYFRKVGVKYTKSNASDVVTEADLAVNDFLIKQIKAKYPDHGIISEETGEDNAQAEYVWIIDPIDGTLNFATATPLFGIMVALMHKGELELGCVDCPALGEFYYAQRGHGMYFNGKKVFCSKKESLDHTYGTVGGLFRPDGSNTLERIIEYRKQTQFAFNTLLTGAVAKSWVASGVRDWYFGHGGGFWDYAPLVLMLRESGCKVTNFKGEPWGLNDRDIIAANEKLHAILLKMVGG